MLAEAHGQYSLWYSSNDEIVLFSECYPCISDQMINISDHTLYGCKVGIGQCIESHGMATHIVQLHSLAKCHNAGADTGCNVGGGGVAPPNQHEKRCKPFPVRPAWGENPKPLFIFCTLE